MPYLLLKEYFTQIFNKCNYFLRHHCVDGGSRTHVKVLEFHGGKESNLCWPLLAVYSNMKKKDQTINGRKKNCISSYCFCSVIECPDQSVLVAPVCDATVAIKVRNMVLTSWFRDHLDCAVFWTLGAVWRHVFLRLYFFNFF